MPRLLTPFRASASLGTRRRARGGSDGPPGRPVPQETKEEPVTEIPASERTRLKRLPERGSHERQVIEQILDAGFICHAGFVADGQPYVIPTLYGRRGDHLYLHGSAASRMLRHLAKGLPVCVTVTLVDGLVLARSIFHHSMNYRSVVVLGNARLVEERSEKLEALRVISEHLIPDRWAEVRPPSEQELKATHVLELEIAEASAKSRSGPPGDDDGDYDLPVWAGVLPLRLTAGEPAADPDLRVKVEVSPSVRRRAEKWAGKR